MFCTQIQKIAIFWADAQLHNFGTVRPICMKIASKVAQDSKEKVAKAQCAKKNEEKKKNLEIIAWNVEGGILPPPPPPPSD